LLPPAVASSSITLIHFPKQGDDDFVKQGDNDDDDDLVMIVKILYVFFSIMYE